MSSWLIIDRFVEWLTIGAVALSCKNNGSCIERCGFSVLSISLLVLVSNGSLGYEL